MIVAWRIAQRMFWNTEANGIPLAFNGVGSSRTGGRWNSKGVPIVYLSDTFALAQFEVLVNVSQERLTELDLGVSRVEMAEHLISNIMESDLPHDWRQSSWPKSTQGLGDEWAKSTRNLDDVVWSRKTASPVLRVPSSLSPSDFNYLLNPLHCDFHKLVKSRHIALGPFQPFTFDSRLEGTLLPNAFIAWQREAKAINIHSLHREFNESTEHG